MAGGDDKAVFVVGDCHELIHRLDLLRLQADPGRDGFVGDTVHRLGAFVGAHREHALQRQRHRFFLAGGEQVGEILDGNAQTADIRHAAVHAHGPGLGCRLNRRQRRHIPHHRQGAKLRVQRERNAPVHRHFPHRRLLRGGHPGVRDAGRARVFLHRGIVGVEEYVQMGLVKVLLIGRRGGRFNAVGVVEHDADVADAADAGFRAHGRLAGLDARVAENAFFRLAGGPVVVDFFIRAGRHAHPPAAAFFLVDEHHAVLFALVNGAGRAGRDARRVEAVLAQARQIHHKSVLEAPVDFLFHFMEVAVFRALGKLAAEDFLPVRAPLDFFHALAGDERARARGRRGGRFGRRLQVLVVEGERLVVIVNLRHVGIGENLA